MVVLSCPFDKCNMKEFVETIGVIVASATAVYGITAWRREFRGKKEHDLAEETLALFYQCRDNLRAIRSPAGYAGEGSTRAKDTSETEEETKILNRAFISFERYEKYKEPFCRLFAIRYRFMALFGRNAAQPIEDLRLALNDVFIAAQMLPHYWQQQGRQHHNEDAFKEHLREMQKQERVFWGTFSSRDEFDVRVNILVDQFEIVCEKILHPEPLRPRRVLQPLSSWLGCGRKSDNRSRDGKQTQK
jgi:hypothetical protein